MRHLLSRFVGSKLLIRLTLAVVLIVLAASTAHAQTTFQTPIWGGTVAQSFNSTQGAKPGWYHTGIDYWGPNMQSTYILASNVGIVHSIVLNGNNDHGMGNCVVIRHTVVVSSNGATYPYYTLYAHMNSITLNLACGQAVNRGQVIGTMGSSGYNDLTYWGKTPHLHFEVRTAGGTSNPYGGGPYWGYTPTQAQNYGYINPAQVIGQWVAR